MRTIREMHLCEARRFSELVRAASLRFTLTFATSYFWTGLGTLCKGYLEAHETGLWLPLSGTQTKVIAPGNPNGPQQWRVFGPSFLYLKLTGEHADQGYPLCISNKGLGRFCNLETNCIPSAAAFMRNEQVNEDFGEWIPTKIPLRTCKI